MRADMKKVLTESPRYGSSRSYHDIRRRENRGELEDLPYHQGMRYPYKGYDQHKEFSDHISPLIRYLWSCVGRSWNDVWSEICTQVPSNNVVDGHLKDHVLGEVDINCVIEDNEVVVIGGRWYSQRKPRGLYVDPRDGLLKAAANDNHNARKSFSKYKMKDTIRIYGGLYRHDSGILVPVYTTTSHWNGHKNITVPNNLHPVKFLVGRGEVGSQIAIHINGIWYSFDIEKVPPSKNIEVFLNDDSFIKKEINYKHDEYYGGSVSKGTYHANKRQMNSRDLKRYGLRNVK